MEELYTTQAGCNEAYMRLLIAELLDSPDAEAEAALRSTLAELQSNRSPLYLGRNALSDTGIEVEAVV